jgi:hypothetical protein
MKKSTALLGMIVLLSQVPANAAGWLDQAKTVMDAATDSKDQSESTNSLTALSTADISGGLKDALRVGIDNVVTQLGQPGGFNQDPAIHIPLP